MLPRNDAPAGSANGRKMGHALQSSPGVGWVM
jgi:hypothetical protein